MAYDKREYAYDWFQPIVEDGNDGDSTAFDAIAELPRGASEFHIIVLDDLKELIAREGLDLMEFCTADDLMEFLETLPAKRR